MYRMLIREVSHCQKIVWQCETNRCMKILLQIECVPHPGTFEETTIVTRAQCNIIILL